MNATVTCEKCGKPLGVFDGNICNECENRAVLDKIRDEIKQEYDNQGDWSFNDGLAFALEIIDKYR